MALILETVLRATGLRTTKLIADEPSFSLRNVAFATPFGEQERAVLYLPAATGMQQLREIRMALQPMTRSTPIAEILLPRSSKLAADRSWVKRELGFQIPARTLHELLENALRKRGTDAEELPSVFLDPSIYVGAGELPVVDPGHKALTALMDWATASPDRNASRLGVLLAGGGVGKTTVSAALCRALREKGRTPVLVTADRWARLSTVGDISLWDIWHAALQHEGLSLPDMDTFDTYVKAGILFPILDGFDELCSQRSDKFDPRSPSE